MRTILSLKEELWKKLNAKEETYKKYYEIETTSDRTKERRSYQVKKVTLIWRLQI